MVELGNNPVDKDRVQELNSELGDYMNHVLNNRSAIGARSNTVSNVKSSNDENILRLKGVYSDMQDVDWAEKYIELTSAQMVYNSSMQVGAKMIQPTLLDYLG